MSKHLAGNDIRDSQENTSGNNVLIKKLGNRLVWFNNLILQKVYRHPQTIYPCIVVQKQEDALLANQPQRQSMIFAFVYKS
jgi:hypothetical protein